jgi:hypothetical protein
MHEREGEIENPRQLAGMGTSVEGVLGLAGRGNNISRRIPHAHVMFCSILQHFWAQSLYVLQVYHMCGSVGLQLILL